MKKYLSDQTAVRILIILLFCSAYALRWDMYSHFMNGRETIWSPPHMAHFFAFSMAILVSCTMWYAKRTNEWREIAITFLLILIITPFDDLWHRMFLDSEWALSNFTPAHFYYAVIGVFLVIFLGRMLQHEKDPFAKCLIFAVLLATLLNSCFAPLNVFMPLGKYQYAGFYGAGIISICITIPLLLSQQSKGFAKSSMMAISFIVLASAGFGADVPGIVFRPYNPMPFYLIAVSFLFPAIAADLLEKYPHWIRGSVIGALYAVVNYLFFYPYLRPEFEYSVSQTMIALVTGTGGGFLAGYVLQELHKRELLFQLT